MAVEHWDWIEQYEASHIYDPYVNQIKELRKEGANQQRSGNFTEAGNLYNECARIAIKGGLLELELVHTYLANTLLTHLEQPDLLHKAVDIVIKCRKLNTDNFPWYPMIQLHLARVYNQLDPLSYVNEVREIYDLVEIYVRHRTNLMYTIQIARSYLELQLHQVKTAQDYATLATEINPDDDYHHTSACNMKAWIYYRTGNFVAALEWFKEMEYHAKKSNELPSHVINSVYQQGVCLLYLNRSYESEECFAHCKNLEDVYQLKVSEWLNHSFYIARREYDIVSSAIDDKLSENNLSTYSQLVYFLGKAVILNLMGQHNTEELSLARKVTQNFKKPEAYDLWIDAVTNGDTFFHNWHKVDHSK